MENTVKFENRFVGFIDVLGFKSLVNDAADSDEKLQLLSKLVDPLSSAVRVFDEAVD